MQKRAGCLMGEVERLGVFIVTWIYFTKLLFESSGSKIS